MHVEIYSKQYGGRGLLFVNRQEYQELLAAKAIEDSFAVDGETRTVTSGDIPASALVALNTPNMFNFLGVPALLGRTFTPADAPGERAPPIAVLSYLFWHRQFGGKKDIIGKTVDLNHAQYTIIGVMPPRFTWFDADVYIPVPLSADLRSHRNAFSRLRPGVSYASATSELSVLVSRWSPAGYAGLSQGCTHQDCEPERRGTGTLWRNTGAPVRLGRFAAAGGVRQRFDHAAGPR